MSLERATVQIFQDSRATANAVAARVADVIRDRAETGKPAVLGLAARQTLVNVYTELVRMHREEGLDFSGAVTFNLDEYWPIDPAAAQSLCAWMHENFLKHVNISPANIHMPRGDVPEEQLPVHCQRYGEAITEVGGIDMLILSVGPSGHIGFNEPAWDRDSRTRRIHLDRITRKDAAANFFGEENVPEMAITVGAGTILAAREICLLAFGEHKASAIRRAVEGGISAHLPVSFFQEHPNATFYVDEAAAAEMTRMAAPWLLGPCQWDDRLTRQAVIWLAGKLGKPILKLTDENYAENGLADLRVRGGAYNVSTSVFRHLMETITGHPAGRDRRCRIVVFSPHPDDDVICMGGTMMRLIEQGHDVHVAYMVSGFLSVFDHDVARYGDFVREFNTIFGLIPEHSAAIEKHIEKFLRQKRSGDVDSPEVQAIKGLIRRTEAVDAAKFCGLDEEHIHFLDMPFYNTGRAQKLSIGRLDVAAVREVLGQIHPEIIFAAGDMSDPHGTHRLCQEAGLAAFEEHVGAGNPRPTLWLYRGAWQEWSPEQIDMAVPLSPAELKRKRYAIFRHQSQKDRAMFPGPFDSREFWQRAEERNIGTAKLYDSLGLPEYHALEAFVRWPLKRSANAAAQLADSPVAP